MAINNIDCADSLKQFWGTSTLLKEQNTFKVELLSIDVGKKLPLQMHYHSLEYWVVLSGTASVTCGDNNTLLFENQSIYIPMTEWHSLENPGKIPLEIIKIQKGSYLGKEDTIHFNDFTKETII
ncbi:MAG TPA: cupin domain-containing protein [Patescibacteria group bacterium]|nr:cupin domain-containing protein [Patescibacteria group bacterium]